MSGSRVQTRPARLKPARFKPGRASLIGGIAVAVASFILWTAIAHELAADTATVLILGLLVAAGVGAWIRLADL